MSDWARRVRPEISQMRSAADDLAQQAGQVPGHAGRSLRMVADCCMIGSIIIGGVLAGVHLWRALFPHHHDDKHGHTPAQPQHDGREEKHRRITIAAESGRSRD
jgi:hypothetical protein